MIENGDIQKRDPTFTPLFFHALSEETKFLRHLRPKFAKKLALSKSENINFLILSLQSTFFHRKSKNMFVSCLFSLNKNFRITRVTSFSIKLRRKIKHEKLNRHIIF